MNKLSFKTNHPTGRYRSFDNISVDIKLNKKKVGGIGWVNKLGGNGGMRVRLMVKDESGTNPNCDWKNIILKKEFEGFSDREQAEKAKEWLQSVWPQIEKAYALMPQED